MTTNQKHSNSSTTIPQTKKFVKLIVDEKGYNNKPSGKEMGSITKRMCKPENVKEISLDTLSNYITSGYTFSVSFAQGGTSDKNFISSDIVALDFDGALTVNEVLDTLNKNNITANIIYYTYSHGEKGERFRVITALSERITDCKKKKKIIKGYQSLFGDNTDNATVAAVQRFLGTNKNLYKPVDLYNTTNKQIFLDLFSKTEILPVQYKPKNDFDLTEALENFDLAAWLKTKYSFDKIYHKGSGICFNPCPICGHNDNFIVTGSKYNCFSTKTGGNSIISFLMQVEKMDKLQAVEYFKYDILGLKRETKPEVKQKSEILPFIKVKYNRNGEKIESVSPPLLADFIRQNTKYLFIKDISTGSIHHYFYQHGCYKLVNSDELKGIIKSFIYNYNKELIKMKDINETYFDITTDLKFIDGDLLNNNENIINFQNCILDLNTMETKPHSPEYFSTIQIPCNWSDEDIKTPVYDNFINTLTDGDTQKRRFIEQFIGAIISNIKGYRMKKALFLVGDGNTGKSQLKTLTEMLIGKGNFTGIDLIDLEQRFGVANLHNKRLAGSSDMGFMDVKDLRTFKKVTGGDTLFGERKGVDGFEFNYNGLLWFCSNQKPRFGGDKGDWVYDRMTFIECNNVIPKEKQDKHLIDKLYAERDGIVKKCILALKKVIDNGYNFDEPASSIKALKEYKIENNNVYRFIEECITECHPSRQRECKKAKVYLVYKAWCQVQCYTPIGRNKFYDEFASYYKRDIDDLIAHDRIDGDVLIDLTLTLNTKKEFKEVYGYDSI